MMNNARHYRGVDIDVWEAQERWMWCVIHPHREGGAIGAAASEREAVCDACQSIDDMLAPRCDIALAVDWEITLSNLERYLAECGERLT